jgi:hypothetical protein
MVSRLRHCSRPVAGWSLFLALLAASVVRLFRIALEEAFFARENERLRQRLRDLDNTKRKKEALAAASGITNDAVLEKLAALNISSETVAALFPD